MWKSLSIIPGGSLSVLRGGYGCTLLGGVTTLYTGLAGDLTYLKGLDTYLTGLVSLVGLKTLEGLSICTTSYRTGLVGMNYIYWLYLTGLLRKSNNFKMLKNNCLRWFILF